MKWISYLLSSIWRLWFLIVFIGVFIAFIPSLFLFTALFKDSKIIAHLTRYWAKLTIWLSFIFPKVIWEEKLNKNEVEKKEYFQEIIKADMEEAGSEDVFRKIKKDFSKASISIDDKEIRDQMEKALLRAKEDFK